jgi:hypothetical protein
MCTSFGLNESLVPDLVQIIRNHQPQIWLSHDAGDVLLALRVRGWRTAILTNGIPSAQAAKVRALGLHDPVDHVIYADEHAPGGKPDLPGGVVTLQRRFDVEVRQNSPAVFSTMAEHRECGRWPTCPERVQQSTQQRFVAAVDRHRVGHAAC